MRKRVLLVPDGMADLPVDELDGRTPLEAARTPAMDALARTGTVGLVRTIPVGMAPGSDVANLAALGYDPRAVYTGRAPLEAANIGVELGADDVAYRCNLVVIENGILRDFTAGHIANAAAATVIERLNESFAGEPFEFHAGVSYRNLMVWRGGGADAVCTPPHDKLDCAAAAWLPRDGAAAATLRDVMARAHAAIVGLGPATDIWLWGQGRAPSITPLSELRGLRGAVVGAVDLVKGIGRYAGMEVVDVAGATGDIDTDYAAKARAALAMLPQVDLVFVHVEAPDEAGHRGSVKEKIRAIERVDAEVLVPLVAAAAGAAIMVMPDHYTPVSLRTHVDPPVPFVFAGGGGPSAPAFGETAAATTGLFLESGAALMDLFLTGTS
jgi:2,3-bisphosphoglycerate-independent phosphoglycerate mutase